MAVQSTVSITVVGRLMRDPEMRTFGNGGAQVTFTIVSDQRIYNRDTRRFEFPERGSQDPDRSLFMNCVASRFIGENVMNSLHQGDRVIAQGYLNQRHFQRQDGGNGTAWELDVQDIGPSLRFATAQVSRNQSGFAGNQGAQGGSGSAGQGGYQGGAGYAGGAGYSQSAPAAPAAAPAAPAVDPWGNAGSNSGSGSFSTFGASSDFGGGDEDPEF